MNEQVHLIAIRLLKLVGEKNWLVESQDCGIGIKLRITVADGSHSRWYLFSPGCSVNHIAGCLINWLYFTRMGDLMCNGKSGEYEHNLKG